MMRPLDHGFAIFGGDTPIAVIGPEAIKVILPKVERVKQMEAEEEADTSGAYRPEEAMLVCQE